MIKILKFCQIIFIILLFKITKTNQLVDDLKLVKELSLSNHNPHTNHHNDGSISSSSIASINYDAPDDCKYQIVNNKYDIKLVCYLRTVNSEFDTTNFSVIPAENTISLAINCDDDIMVKSSLEPKSFMHLTYLNELSLEYCKFIKLKKDVLFGMDGLKNLTIRTHNINWPALSLEIEADSFVYTKNLEKLDLSCNNIWSLPENLFCNLNALKWLNVSENRLQDVNDIGFREKSNAHSEYSCSLDVELLDISHNHFVLLPNNSFGLLKRLKCLKLHNNEISMIADTALNGLKNLQIINLSSNRIVALPPKLFEDQSKSIQEIYLHNNSITVLSPGLFSNLDQLQALDLSQNQLTSSWIKSNTFAGLIRLVLLNLSHNKITKLDAAIFIDLYQLQILNLCFNHIEILPANTFSPMNNLHTLLLSNNRIKYLDAASLNGLYVLSLLSLDNNQMGDIHLDAFKNCSSLQDLNLNGNQLKRIPESLNDLRLLRTLDLGENHITYINNFTFTGMFSLYGIRLIGNKIENITKNTFKNLPNLQILNLARNKIATIENGSFEIITTIQAIRLDGNLVASINGLFENMTNLLWLNISDNKLSQFDYAQIPQNLQWLDLHKNNLTELTDRLNFEQHLHLQTLDASFNRITKITSHSFPNSIELLFLNDNLITTIEPYTFVLKTNLTRVDLYANQLTTLDIKALRLDAGSTKDKFLPEFYIGGNPFVCDCNIDWLQKINHVTTQQYPVVMDIDTVYCKLLYNRDRSFIQLIKAEPKHFLCSYHIHCFALCQCCDFDACDCEMTCPQNCTCFHDQSWSTNIVVCSQSGYNEIPSNVPMDTTELYIDGNNFTTLSGHSFIGRKNLVVLYTNNSNIEHIYNTTFSGLRRLIILHLEQNRIQQLHGNEFTAMENLSELYLHKNALTSIDNRTFMALKALEVLTLSDNKLVRYDLMFVQQYNVNLKRVTLSGNLWTCDCKFLMKFQKFLNLKGDKIWDSSQIGCVYNNSTNIVKERNGIKCMSKNELADSLSSNMSNMDSLLPLLLIVTCSLIGFSALIFGVFCYRRELKFWMYSNMCYRSNDMLNDKMHDAYIIHSLQDDHFISQILGLVLENDIGLNLCLHYRDLNLNAYITDSILDAVDNSKRIIIVLSKNFLYNEWSRFEYKSAIYDILKKQKKIIFILYGDLPQKDIDHNMKEYLKINTCIEWDDTKFWKKLRITLPKSKSSSTVVAAAAHQAAAVHKMGKNKNFKNQTQFINSAGGNIIITKNNNISISISSTPSVSSSALGCDLNDINNCGGGGGTMIVDTHNNIVLGGGNEHSGHCPYSDYNNYSTINCNSSSIINNNNNSNNKSIFKINCDIKNNTISNSTTKLDKIYNINNNNNNNSNNLINSNNCILSNEYASIPPRSCIYVNNNSCSTLDKKRNSGGGGGGICGGAGITGDYNNSIDSVDINIVNNKERDRYFNFNCKHFNYNLNSSPCNNQYKNDLCNMKQICNETMQQCNNDTA